MSNKSPALMIIGIVAVLFILNYFGVFELGALTGEENEYCKVIGDSCKNYEDCKMIYYNGKNIACINGEKIIKFDDIVAPAPISAKTVGGIQ